MAVREASHAGSWYSSNVRELNKQLEGWLGDAELSHGPAKAIIAPHAGYQYCGACSAYAYRQISPAIVKKIFILGPSHHYRLAGCGLSNVTKFATPFYDLHIDQEIYAELLSTRQFEQININVDENEHSLEMQLPYIAKVMENYKDQFTIIPVMVGSLSPAKEEFYGEMFSKYLMDPTTIFVISSDFCHWGERFHYTFYDKGFGRQIHECITSLDKMGMNIIENVDATGFLKYLRKYSNTICGRHPIAVLLQALTFLRRNPSCPNLNLKFLKYAQSSKCFNLSDSSVSYASASLIFE
jgi:AmmeMemoRadiSam system protein B